MGLRKGVIRLDWFGLERRGPTGHGGSLVTKECSTRRVTYYERNLTKTEDPIHLDPRVTSRQDTTLPLGPRVVGKDGRRRKEDPEGPFSQSTPADVSVDDTRLLTLR